LVVVVVMVVVVVVVMAPPRSAVVVVVVMVDLLVGWLAGGGGGGGTKVCMWPCFKSWPAVRTRQMTILELRFEKAPHCHKSPHASTP
jgi:hypothetical protein